VSDDGVTTRVPAKLVSKAVPPKAKPWPGPDRSKSMGSGVSNAALARAEQIWALVGVTAAINNPAVQGTRAAYTLGAGGLAIYVTTHTGGKCATDESNGLVLCVGGYMPAVGGGTTYGFTFVSLQIDPKTGKLADLSALMEDRYAGLRHHEAVHAKQGETWGVVFPVAYGIAEAVGEHRFPGTPRGCHNIFEQEAGLPEGFYVCS